MIFTSLEYLVFLAICFLIYWKLSSKYQLVFLVIASYLFYGWWDWRFIPLIFFLTMANYWLGHKIHSSETIKQRKTYLWISLVISLGVLGFFKYFNFFIDSFQELLLAAGFNQVSLGSLNIILPVGISFYTFQILSYVIDIYRKQIQPEKKLINFFAFASFFPQLLAGPIGRASQLLKQYAEARKFQFSQAVDGSRQILWGFFKKIVIADTLAIVVNNTFSDLTMASGGELLIAMFFFAFQLYCDFSAYSDIAIGSGKLLGVNLMKNFAYPYFSRNIAEFWRRWHISLSSYLRDYVYYPLVFSKSRKTKAWLYLSVLITFILVGLWHGAGWNYVAMGAIFGSYLIIGMIMSDLKKASSSEPKSKN